MARDVLPPGLVDHVQPAITFIPHTNDTTTLYTDFKLEIVIHPSGSSGYVQHDSIEYI